MSKIEYRVKTAKGEFVCLAGPGWYPALEERSVYRDDNGVIYWMFISPYGMMRQWPDGAKHFTKDPMEVDIQ